MDTHIVLSALRHIVPLPFLIATGAASALPAPANAATQQAFAARPPIFAFSDSRTLPTESTLLAKLPGAKSQICAGARPAPLASLTLDQALAHIHAYLLRTYGTKALATLDQAPRIGNADQAEHVAAGAMLANVPGAGLEATLLARQKAPADPRPLVNAAALLPDLGMANEALALLDAADRLPTPKGGAPLGIPLPAVSLTNRGYALLALHRWRQAEAPLQQASRLSAYLPEADLNLGEAFLCAGDETQAAHYFVAGGRRDTFRPDVVESIGEPPAVTSQVQADELFDLSHGVERRLPDLKYPSTPEQGVAMYPVYAKIEASIGGIFSSNSTRIVALTARLPRNLNTATLRRTQDIMAAMANADFAAGVHEKWTRMNADMKAVDRFFVQYTGWDQALPAPACISQIRRGHRQWLPMMQALDRDTRFW